jgi:hypothetical protein
MAAHASRIATDTVDSSTGTVAAAPGSVRDGAYEIQARASEALPATGRFLGRVVYNSAYAVSFGVTFPVMMVVRAMPKENALVHGLVDGALAARDRVHEWRGEPEGDLHDAEDEVSRASENGSAHHEATSEHTTRRRPKAKRSATKKTTRSSSRKKT